MTSDLQHTTSSSRSLSARTRRPAGATRTRGAASVLALLAVAGLSAAYIGPMSAAIAPAEAAEPARVSLYAATQSDAQAYDGDAVGASVDDLGRSRITYGMAMIPKPTPTPTPVPEPAPEPEPAASSSSSEASAPPAEESSEASSSAAASSPLYSGGGAPADWMAAAGIAESDWGYVDYIVSRESGWDPNATNSSSGACGLVQALPCSKVPGNGYDPVDNLRWANDYAVGRYGSWASAYDFWTSNHWW